MKEIVKDRFGKIDLHMSETERAIDLPDEKPTPWFRQSEALMWEFAETRRRYER